MNSNLTLIEELAANAWPSEIEQLLEGWRIRYTRGITRRGNSVHPLRHYGQMSLEEKLEQVEDFYRRWGEPPCFQMTDAAQPQDLIEALAARGYQDDFHTQVRRASLADVFAKTKSNPAFKLILEEELTTSWMDGYFGFAGYGQFSGEVRQGILSRIGPRRAFIELEMGSKLTAVGLGVLERGWVGIFCMVTGEDHRRQGAASHILHTIAAWGQRALVTERSLG